MSSLRKTMDFLASEFEEIANRNATLALKWIPDEPLESEFSAGASVAWQTAAEMIRDALKAS